MIKKIAFTKDGLEKYKKERADLTEQRVTAVKNLSDARSMGDLSENGAYRANKSKVLSIDSRLRYLNRIISLGYIIEPPISGTIGIGSFVTIADEKGNVKNLQIVGSHESDVNNSKISCYSPVGKALIGKKEKEVVFIFTPSGNKEYSIKKIINNV